MKQRSPEAEQRRIEALCKAMKNPEVRAKMSLWQKGKPGRKKTQEEIEKIRDTSIKIKSGQRLVNLGISTRFREGFDPRRTGFTKGYKATELHKRRNSEAKKRLFTERPEKHPNYIMAQKGFVSKPQKKLYESICRIFPKDIVFMEHPVRISKTTRYIDVAVPIFNLGFECDGGYWHQDPEKDRLRDLELQKEGWEVKHISAKLLS